MKQLIIAIGLFFSLVPSPVLALQLILPDNAYQGDMFVGRVLPPATVSVGGTTRPVSPQGYFVIGVPRRQKTDLLVLAQVGNKKTLKIIRILAYRWQIQRIDGLPEWYINPPPEGLKQIKEDSKRIRAIRQAKPYPVPLFLENGFIKPTQGSITGIFGSKRILNSKPRSLHWGVDFAAPMNTPVYSPADGIVKLVAKDMYLMGNTLIIDHGLGVQSIFVHLNSIEAKESEFVKQGATIARVGKTGRATGPHLHWGISVGTIPVDPVRMLKKSVFILP